MQHIIINQYDKLIDDEYIRKEINHALDNDLDHTYFDGVKIDITSDKKMDGERVTVVCVDGI